MKKGGKQGLRISLVHVSTPYFSYTAPPQALLYLASYLIRNRLVDKSHIQIINSGKKDTFSAMERFHPDVVGLSVTTPAYPEAISLAKKIKKQIGAFVVIDGHHISGIPETFDKPFDIGVIGEGEEALADIIQLIQKKKNIKDEDYAKIKNLVFRNEKHELVITDRRRLMPVELIAPIYWDLLPIEHVKRKRIVFINGVAEAQLYASIFTARGCPYRCIFCARQLLWSSGGGYRAFPIERVVNEIEFLYRTYHIRHIGLSDDTFTVSKDRVRQLIVALEKRKLLGKILFPGLYIRSNLVDREFMILLKKLGVTTVVIGIESGSQRVLRYLKSGPLTVGQVKKAILLCEEFNISMRGNFMLFSPHETKRDFDLSYKLAQWFVERKTTISLDLYVTIPFPGTAMWNEAIQMGIINPSDIDWYKFLKYSIVQDIEPYVFFKNGMTHKQLMTEWKRFYALSIRVKRKTEKTPEWVEADKEEETYNRRQDALYATKIRMRLFMQHPIEGFRKLLRNKGVWNRIYKDIVEFIFGKV